MAHCELTVEKNKVHKPLNKKAELKLGWGVFDDLTKEKSSGACTSFGLLNYLYLNGLKGLIVLFTALSLRKMYAKRGNGEGLGWQK
jgi:hypothetical protein